MSSTKDDKKNHLEYFKYDPLHNQHIIINNRNNFETITSICSPLTQELKIPYFIYRAFFDNNKVIYLANNQEWVNTRFERSTHHNSVFRSKIHLDDPETKEKLKIFVWENGDREDSVYSLLHDMKMWNGISLYRKVPNCLESYHFAGTPDDHHLVDFLLSNLGLFKRFIYYFQERASSLIAEEKAFAINNTHPKNQSENHEDENNRCISKFIDKTNLSKFHFTIDNRRIELTRRQAECFSYMVQGKSAKEIALLLNISSRTVESYIEQIKYKIGYSCKSHLINRYDQTFLEYYFKSQENLQNNEN